MKEATPDRIVGSSDSTAASVSPEPDMLADPTIACFPISTTLECRPSRLWMITPALWSFARNLASVCPDLIDRGEASVTSTSPVRNPTWSVVT
jgi:hypothetical protein